MQIRFYIMLVKMRQEFVIELESSDGKKNAYGVAKQNGEI